MRNRRRDARHPVVLCAAASWTVLSASQLWFGPVSSAVVRDMGHSSQITFGILLLAGSLACILSAVVGREPLGAKIELFGMFSCAVALGFYSWTLPSSVASWNTTVALGLAGCAVGCILRAGFVGRLIRHRGPS